MRKNFDKELEKKLHELRARFPIYSRQEESVLRVGWDVRSACSSLIPNSYLRLAQDKVETYEKKESSDVGTVNGLWDVINNAWDLYGEMEVAA